MSLLKEPKFNIAVWSSLLLGIESLMFGIWTNYKFHFSWFICLLLIGFIFCVIGFFINFYIHYWAYNKLIKDISIKHEALAKEFDKKNKILDEYEYIFANLGSMIIFAMTPLNESEKIVFRNIYELLSNHNKKISGVKNNE